jgi:hypothetical protein
MAPILPGISDRPEQLTEVARAAAEAGAAFLGAGSLTLKAGTREHFLEALERDWPELLPRYRRLYAGRISAPPAAAEPALGLVTRLRDDLGIADRRPAEVRPPVPPSQLLLAV